jgi:hypothetical protein
MTRINVAWTVIKSHDQNRACPTKPPFIFRVVLGLRAVRGPFVLSYPKTVCIRYRRDLRANRYRVG